MVRPTFGADDRHWWLIGNRYGGMSAGYGRSAAEARGDVREAIAESFEGEGLSPSAARRAAQTYGVCVHAGGLTYDEARDARQEWADRGLTAIERFTWQGPPPLADVLRRRWLTQTGRPLDAWMTDEVPDGSTDQVIRARK